MFKAHLAASLNQELERLTTSTFTNLDDFGELQAFSDQLLNTNYYLYHARTCFQINIDKSQEFLESWVFKDGHCYVLDYDKKIFRIALNFPGADQLILKQIKEKLQRVLDSSDVIQGEATGICNLKKDFTLLVW